MNCPIVPDYSHLRIVLVVEEEAAAAAGGETDGVPERSGAVSGDGGGALGGPGAP